MVNIQKFIQQFPSLHLYCQLLSSSYFLTWRLKIPIKNDRLDKPLVIKKNINPEADYSNMYVEASPH